MGTGGTAGPGTVTKSKRVTITAAEKSKDIGYKFARSVSAVSSIKCNKAWAMCSV